jgi:hypothetical protein
MKRLILMAALPLLLVAGDADYNGRWNIRVKTPRGRVWWLDVQGAGTGKITGSFIGVPGGTLDDLVDARIENGELVFRFERFNTVQVYRARYENGLLRGRREETPQGKGMTVLDWTGVRAPEIPEHDDGTWKPARTVKLFNGTSLEGWRKMLAERPGWHVEDGLLKNEKNSSDLASEARFWNFEARFEYRYTQGSNSGVGVRGRYEIQIEDSFGKLIDSHIQGALYSRIPPVVNASRPAGQWQLMVIRMVGRDLTVMLNGQTVLDKVRVVGPTAITSEPEEGEPGPFVLQGDHGPVEFRLIEVTELKQR